MGTKLNRFLFVLNNKRRDISGLLGEVVKKTVQKFDIYLFASYSYNIIFLKKAVSMKFQHTFLFLSLILIAISGCSRLESQLERQARLSVLDSAEENSEETAEKQDEEVVLNVAAGQPGQIILAGLGVRDSDDGTKINTKIKAVAKAGRLLGSEEGSAALAHDRIDLKSPYFVVVQAENYQAKTYAQVGCKDQIDALEIQGYTEVVSYISDAKEMKISADKVFICDALEYQNVTTHEINSNQLFLKNVTVNWSDRKAQIQFVTNQLILSGANEFLMNEKSNANDFIAVSEQKMSLSVIDPNGIRGEGSLYMEIRGADRVE
jgi:hypothetical protein